MSDDLSRVLRSTGPVEELVQSLRNYAYEQIGYLQINEKCLDAADLIEAQAAEITRLRAAINDALTAPWPVPELNSTWHQEPIGPNETPEEAIKRLVNVRAEWAVYKNDCENPVIAELRAALATARREGMEAMAEKIAGWHDAQAKHHDGMELEFRTIAEHLDPDAMQLAMRFFQAANQHRQRANEIRAAAKEGK